MWLWSAFGCGKAFNSSEILAEPLLSWWMQFVFEKTSVFCRKSWNGIAENGQTDIISRKNAPESDFKAPKSKRKTGKLRIRGIKLCLVPKYGHYGSKKSGANF